MTGPVPFEPRAVVFDLDGTLADNMAWHAQAFQTFLERHGRPALTLEMRRRIDGKTNADIMPILFERDLTPDEVDAYAAEKEGLYREISRGRVRATAGVYRLLEGLEARDVRVAVATSAPPENVRHTLSELGLTDRLAVIARSDEVPRGKPAPDVFLRAATLLGIAPASCLAFEDAPVGVAAARAAGMRCVAVTLTFTPEAFAAHPPPPHATCRDFDDYLAGEGAWIVQGLGLEA